MTPKIATLILAGGKNKDKMRAACGGITNRAMVPLNGMPMLEYVVAAVRGGASATNGGRILVAGDVPTPIGCVAVEGGLSMIDTLYAGVDALKSDETRLLVVTSDIPFLTADALMDFAARATALGPEVDFAYPIIPAQACATRFPTMRRTTLRIAEGRFTGGNLALLDPEFLRRNDAILRDAYARRKSIIGLARLLGPETIFRLLASRAVPAFLTIRNVEEAVGRALGGVNVRAVVTDYAEIGADVDKPEDLEIAERTLLARPSPVPSVDFRLGKRL